jgi:hypothetical protein
MNIQMNDLQGIGIRDRWRKNMAPGLIWKIWK